MDDDPPQLNSDHNSVVSPGEVKYSESNQEFLADDIKTEEIDYEQCERKHSETYQKVDLPEFVQHKKVELQFVEECEGLNNSNNKGVVVKLEKFETVDAIDTKPEESIKLEPEPSMMCDDFKMSEVRKVQTPHHFDIESAQDQRAVFQPVRNSRASDPISDEFDIRPLEECDIGEPVKWTSQVEVSPKREALPDQHMTPVTAVAPGKNADEFADIQQRLSSFHSENLMILQSRNKKKHSRTTTPTMDDECSGGTSRNVSPDRIAATSTAIDSGSTKRMKGKHLNFDETLETAEMRPQSDLELIPVHSTIDDLPEAKPICVESTSSFGPTNIEASHYSSFLLNTNPESVAAVTFNLAQPPPPPPPFSPPLSSTTISCDPVILQSASLAAALPPPPPPPLPHPSESTSNTSPPSTPFFNQFPEVVSQLPAVVGTKSLLSEYLENPNKTTSFASVPFPAPIPAHSMFNVAISPYSTLEATTSTELPVDDIPTPPPPAVSPALVGTCPKIVTRTQSNDPRLNPILAAPVPPPTPKRKLSINEYRKRKQQSIGPSEVPVEGATKSGSSLKQSGNNSTTNYPSMLAMPTCLSLDSPDGGSPKLNGGLTGSLQSPDDKITGRIHQGNFSRIC